MKEKVDAYLSLAGFAQLLIIGAGGGFVTEMFSESPKFEMLLLCGLSGVVFVISCIILYVVIFEKTNKSKL